MIGQTLANLFFVADNRVCSGLDIVIGMHLVSRTNDNVGLWGKLTNLFQDHHCGTVVRNGNHDRLGLCNVSVFQHVTLGGVADRSVKTELLGATDSILIEVDHRYAAVAIDERLSCDLARGSESDDDHVGTAH